MSEILPGWSRHRTRAFLSFLLAAVVSVGMLVSTSADADAAAGRNRLYAGERLTADQQLTSDSGKLTLVMQGDGNLVLYAPGGKARWHTNSNGNPGAYAVMQGDGNLVVYTAGGVPLWESQTYGTGAAFAQIQDDGNFVVYTSAPKAVWQSGTKYYPSRLDAGGALAAGQRLQSPNGVFEAVMQGDGNFVLYGPSGWTWQSGTNGSGANRASVQTDGNIVLYTAANAWKWQSRTDGKGAGFLQVQDDGNMVLYNSASQWIWQTYTYPGYQPPTPPAAPTPSKARLAIDYATAQIGKPYQWGATGPGAFDCSGLTQRSWAAAGVSIARVSRDQYTTLPKVPFSQAQPGDILAWSSNTSDPSRIYHVALYIGDGKMIEAPSAGNPVRLTTVRTYGLMPSVARPAS
jgi:cell wall-associated NlpC family hydrolase